MAKKRTLLSVLVAALICACFVAPGIGIAAESSISSASASLVVAGRNYTGSSLEATVSVSLDGDVLEKDVDYRVLYDGSTSLPVNVKDYSVSIQGIGSYSGTKNLGTFSIYDNPVTVGTQYHVVSAADDDLVLDVAGKVPVSGANVSVWTNNGGSNQLFTFELGTDGFYTLRNVGNNSLVLDAAGKSPVCGANVSTWIYNGGLNQKWVIIPTGTGSYTIASAFDTSFVLDAASNPPSMGSNISIWTAKGGANQAWTFEDAMNIEGAQVSTSAMATNFTGSALELTISVTMYGQTLTKGSDYKVLYNDSEALPQAVGFYSVKLQAQGSYKGTKNLGTFSIYDNPVTIGTQYHVVSAADDDLVLDVAGKVPASGANVSVWTNNGGTNQLFTFELGTDGFYTLRNVGNNSLVLDAAGKSPVCGANVSTWIYNGGLNQKWVIIPTGTGSYTIASAFDTSFVLDAAGNPPSMGSNISIWTAKGGANQAWTFEDSSNISSAIVSGAMAANYTGSSLEPKLVISMYGKVLEKGTDYTVQYNGGSNLPLEVGDYSVTILGKGAYQGSKSLGNFSIYSNPVATDGTWYHIQSAYSSQFVLDVAGKKPVSGANVSVWTDNGGTNQLFTFELGTDGFYTLRNVGNNSLVLDAAGKSPVCGANVSTWTYNGGLNQKWVIIPTGTGSYTIASAFDTSFVLDAAGNPPSTGSNISIWTANGGSNQAWKFVSKNVDGDDIVLK